MARRTELIGICDNLLSSFISRNNDFDGYWALGQCKAWLEDEGAIAVSFVLLGQKTTHETQQVAAITRHFSAVFAIMLSRHKLNVDWVKEAQVTLEIESAEQVKCSILLISDLGRRFRSMSSVKVWSHDPSRESRRSRVDWGIRYKRNWGALWTQSRCSRYLARILDFPSIEA